MKCARAQLRKPDFVDPGRIENKAEHSEAPKTEDKREPEPEKDTAEDRLQRYQKLTFKARLAYRSTTRRMFGYVSEELATDSDREEYFNLLGVERTALGGYQDLKTEEITALCAFAIEEERAARPFQIDPAWADSWEERRSPRTDEFEIGSETP
jgi:hypothetical protein